MDFIVKGGLILRVWAKSQKPGGFRDGHIRDRHIYPEVGLQMYIRGLYSEMGLYSGVGLFIFRVGLYQGWTYRDTQKWAHARMDYILYL